MAPTTEKVTERQQVAFNGVIAGADLALDTVELLLEKGLTVSEAIHAARGIIAEARGAGAEGLDSLIEATAARY